MKKSIKNKLKTMMVAVVLSAVSMPALSVAVWGWGLKSMSVISGLDGTVQVLSTLNGAVWKPCGTIEWYTFDVTQPGGPAMQSALLSALVTGKTLSLIYDCDNNTISAVKIDA
jgi:hypothetical protein